jgi:two-component system sensor kinase FixL
MRVIRPERQRILLLALVMAGVALVVLCLTVLVLFLTAQEQNKRIMMSYVEHQASMLEAVYSLVPEQDRIDDTLPTLVTDHIRQVLRQNPVITDSGEMLFAFRESGQIHFVSPYRFATSRPLVVDMNDTGAKAMRLALEGHAGVMRTLDYRGVEVIAAFMPVNGMNLGVVVKIDLAEVARPFSRTALVAGLATLGVILLGVWLIQTVSKPLIQRLEENETKYRTLFESANEGILVMSDRIEECNDQVLKMLGYRKEEMIGRRIVEFTPEPQLQGDASQDRVQNRFELARQGKPQYFSWRSQRKDGMEIDVDVMLKSVQVGRMTFILATLLDITDRRRAELDLRRAEKQVVDAREHLAHMARLSTMGEMATGIAHEINQPLAAIATYAQACKRMLDSGTRDATEFADPLEKIATQALRASEVIRRLRGFIKKSASEMEVMDCNQLVADVVKLAEVDARRYDISIHTHLAAALPAVHADPVQLQQVLLNLIRNALEAMEEIPRERARVDVHTDMEQDGRISIRVIDCGPGLSQDDLESVFEPFFTTKLAGMGMGLSISRSIIEAHKGQLFAHHNEDGLGVCFRIVLPAHVTGL